MWPLLAQLVPTLSEHFVFYTPLHNWFQEMETRDLDMRRAEKQAATAERAAESAQKRVVELSNMRIREEERATQMLHAASSESEADLDNGSKKSYTNYSASVQQMQAQAADANADAQRLGAESAKLFTTAATARQHHHDALREYEKLNAALRLAELRADQERALEKVRDFNAYYVEVSQERKWQQVELSHYRIILEMDQKSLKQAVDYREEREQQTKANKRLEDIAKSRLRAAQESALSPLDGKDFFASCIVFLSF